MFWFPYSHRRHADPVPGSPALEVHALCVAHPGAPTLALNDVSLTLPVGVRAALIGPNGAGKSTLLKAITGLLPIQSGALRIAGLPVGACHHRVAYLPQRGEIDWRFPINVRRLVMTGRYVHLGWLRRPGARDLAIVDDVLGKLGLRDLADRQIGELSGGQQQRALLARALVQEADLLLLDEPFNAVDDATRAIIIKVLDDLRRQGKTSLVATHDLKRIAAHFERIIELRDGRLISDTRGTQNEEALEIAV